MTIETIDHALAVVRRNGSMLARIDYGLRTAEVCEAAVRQTDYALRYVPASLQRAVVERIIPDAPVVLDIHKAVSDAVGAYGEHLSMRDWHAACWTTHCRAGWVIALAGAEGEAEGAEAIRLEAEHGAGLAAAAIYFASDRRLVACPDFYCDDDAALADIQGAAAMAL